MRRRFLFVALALALVAGPAGAQPVRSRVLLPQTTIAGAVTGLVGETVLIPQGARNLTVQAKFLYGSGGTTTKAWVQTSVDGGTTWTDIMTFAFTLSAATKVSAVRLDIAMAAAYVPTDATLADDTIKDGLLGDRIRLKWTTTGTYGGATSLAVSGVIQ